jgi:hypothetical protein
VNSEDHVDDNIGNRLAPGEKHGNFGGSSGSENS